MLRVRSFCESARCMRCLRCSTRVCEVEHSSPHSPHSKLAAWVDLSALSASVCHDSHAWAAQLIATTAATRRTDTAWLCSACGSAASAPFVGVPQGRPFGLSAREAKAHIINVIHPSHTMRTAARCSVASNVVHAYSHRIRAWARAVIDVNACFRGFGPSQG
jgi:hypothetical protein